VIGVEYASDLRGGGFLLRRRLSAHFEIGGVKERREFEDVFLKWCAES
jgi:hypothetical protein